jgi:exopolysaccharide production protein ExoY
MLENEFRIPTWKRIFDLLLIAMTVPLWLPLMIVIAAVVKVVSPGPVFFRQSRVGYKGRHFMILKFRSMKMDAPTKSHESHVEKLIQTDRPMTKLDVAGDSRMIPGGWVMRASGLDEIPQIFNVIQGEMSLVGPRPCIPKEFDCYKPEQKRRVEAPPGLTGLWQVNGKNRLTFTQMIELDLRYKDSMSLWMDTMILLRTVPAILGQVGDAKKKLKSRASGKGKEEVAPEFRPGAEFGPLGDVQ